MAGDRQLPPVSTKSVHPAAVAACGVNLEGRGPWNRCVGEVAFQMDLGNPGFLPLLPQQRPVPCSRGQVTRGPSGSPWPGSARLFMASQEPGLGSRWTLLRDELPTCLWVTHCVCLPDSWGRGMSGCSPWPTCPGHHLLFSLPWGLSPSSRSVQAAGLLRPERTDQPPASGGAWPLPAAPRSPSPAPSHSSLLSRTFWGLPSQTRSL